MKHSILVVEDTRDSRELLRLFFGSRGFRVIMGETGLEALYLTALQHPDLIITDIGLPDMSGIALIGRLRKLYNGNGTPPILAVTGYGEAAAQEALCAGASNVAIKPLDLDLLLSKVNEMLASVQAGQFDDARSRTSSAPA